MKSTILAASMALIVSTTGAFAQSDAKALEIAEAQEACGDGQNDLIISARFLEDGRVGVRCARPAGLLGSGAVAGAATTGFGGAAAAAGIFTLVLTAAAVGGSSSTSDTR